MNESPQQFYDMMMNPVEYAKKVCKELGNLHDLLDDCSKAQQELRNLDQTNESMMDAWKLRWTSIRDRQFIDRIIATERRNAEENKK